MESDEGSQRESEMERMIARGTNGVREGRGGWVVDVEEEEENVCWRMSFAIEAAGYQGS